MGTCSCCKTISNILLSMTSFALNRVHWMSRALCTRFFLLMIAMRKRQPPNAYTWKCANFFQRTNYRGRNKLWRSDVLAGVCSTGEEGGFMAQYRPIGTAMARIASRMEGVNTAIQKVRGE
jgi:hypothetical protein